MDASEAQVEHFREGADHQCFGQTRQAYHQHMAARHECQHEAVENFLLADDGFADFRHHPIQERHQDAQLGCGFRCRLIHMGRGMQSVPGGLGGIHGG